MPIYAVVSNNTVENVIVADSLEIAEAVTTRTCIENTNNQLIAVGYTWDGENFIAPVTEEPTE